jgi:hypothetical protein
LEGSDNYTVAPLAAVDAKLVHAGPRIAPYIITEPPATAPTTLVPRPELVSLTLVPVNVMIALCVNGQHSLPIWMIPPDWAIMYLLDISRSYK